MCPDFFVRSLADLFVAEGKTFAEPKPGDDVDAATERQSAVEKNLPLAGSAPGFLDSRDQMHKLMLSYPLDLLVAQLKPS
jgi:hypothetical protein